MQYALYFSNRPAALMAARDIPMTFITVSPFTPSPRNFATEDRDRLRR